MYICAHTALAHTHPTNVQLTGQSHHTAIFFSFLGAACPRPRGRQGAGGPAAHRARVQGTLVFLCICMRICPCRIYIHTCVRVTASHEPTTTPNHYPSHPLKTPGDARLVRPAALGAQRHHRHPRDAGLRPGQPDRPVSSAGGRVRRLGQQDGGCVKVLGSGRVVVRRVRWGGLVWLMG